MRRTQIYLEDEQHSQLAKQAAEEGTTTSELIRQAIHAYLQQPKGGAEWQRRWRAAVDAAAGSAPYLSATHVQDLRNAALRRQEELEQRWRG